MDDVTIKYPEGLPIAEHREEILAAIRSSQVVVVQGDTGSGKTTQLPKMAMELGFGRDGRMIACTQPRRLAAVSVAERVAFELGSETGGVIGFQHRFAKKVSDDTRVKFMTDGVLLSETRHDPLLRAYDLIIVDEAHERSLNIDFLLGILKRALAKRRDLKVVVSSATLDAGAFSRFFGDAPVVSVPGRLFPIEIRHLSEDEEEGPAADLPRSVSAAIRELPADFDTLVFLPGERDIRETADHLARSPSFRGDDIIPLMASLPASETARAFRKSPRRRIILSTNVAETSVTIPGIRAVVDSGLARISRYVHRTQVQRLQIEPVSQASARQRAGRCGRTGPGICIRLYSEKDFLSREPYTPPEVLRSSLAGVILTMLDLRLGNIERFPFIDPPRPAMVREGFRELLELGAISRPPGLGADAAAASGEKPIRLTDIGRRLARIPVEPRHARMMIEASRLASLPSVIPLVAAMSCDDPRRRPVDEKEKADAAHAQFREKGSDFLGTLKMWRWWEKNEAELSQTQLRKLCQKNYLSYPKMREWRDIVRQLFRISKELRLDVESDNGGPDAMHRSLLTGLLSRIGHIDPERPEYRGARGIRFSIHPGSVLSRGRGMPEWIVAGELVDTSRLFARAAAVVDPAWIEPAASGLCKYSYRDPQWDARSGFVRAIEQVTLYGLVIVPSRRRDYSRIDPVESRRLFIFHGLVLGEFPDPPQAVRENLSVIGEMRRRSERLRNPALFDMDRLAAHFDAAIPAGIVSAGELRKWLYAARAEEKARFRLDRREWLSGVVASSAEYPDSIRIGGAKFALSYRHSPDDPESDGITCTVKKADAGLIPLWRSDWLVPGALPEKVSWLLSSLPSSYRRVLSPIADTVSVVLPLLHAGEEPLVDALRRVLREHNGIRIPPDAWDLSRLPPHLSVRFRIRGEDGRVIAEGRDTGAVLAAAGIRANGSSACVQTDDAPHVEWDFGALPEFREEGSAGLKLTHYPALVDVGSGVAIRLFNSRAAAARAHESGVARLVYLRMTKSSKPSYSPRRLPLSGALYFKTLGYDAGRVASDLLYASIMDAAVKGREEIRDAQAFDERVRATKVDVSARHAELLSLFEKIISLAGECAERAESGGLRQETVDSIETQLAWLVFPGFVKSVPRERLARYPAYFKALAIRTDRARTNPMGDMAKESRFAPYWERYREAVVGKKKPADAAALAEYRWMAEEYRISVFAPEVGTSATVSPKRLDEKWEEAFDS